MRVLQMMEPLIIVVWQKNCAISHLMYSFSLALLEHFLAPIDEDLSLRQALMKIFSEADAMVALHPIGPTMIVKGLVLISDSRLWLELMMIKRFV